MKVSVGPELLLPPFSKLGITTTVVVIGLVPVFTAVNPMSLEPVLVKPVVGSVLVHEYVEVPPVLIVENGISTLSPSETTMSTVEFTWAVGLTVISKGVAGPVQLTPPFSNIGVTVIVAITGFVPLFIAVKAGMFPVPEAAKPIEVKSFVQLNIVVPFILAVENSTKDVSNPFETIWFPIEFTWPVGFTVISNVIGSPTLLSPPFSKLGVTTIVPEIGASVVFVAVISIFPVPAFERPISELSLVHVYVIVPPVILVVNSSKTFSSLQTTWSSIGFTWANGFTVTT